MPDIERIQERLNGINTRLTIAAQLTRANHTAMQDLVPKVERPENEVERAGVEIEKLTLGSDDPRLVAARNFVAEADEQFDAAGEAFNIIVSSLGRAAELLTQANQEVLNYRQERGL